MAIAVVARWLASIAMVLTSSGEAIVAKEEEEAAGREKKNAAASSGLLGSVLARGNSAREENK